MVSGRNVVSGQRMPHLPPPIERMLAVRRAARDQKWAAAVEKACSEALVAGRFAEAYALAEELQPRMRRERDLARLGLGLPMGSDAHPEALRAARALAGPDPALVAGMKASDPRRRSLELHWELQAGQNDLALARLPRRLPSGDTRAWWHGVLLLVAGDLDSAAYEGRSAPGELGRWSGEHSGLAAPSTPLGKYARALAERDTCGAGVLFRPEFAADPDAGRIAAMMAVCDDHRAHAERHAAAISDPFTQALWRMRRRLVRPGPGWEAVARAAENPRAGWRAAAAPLAWLRAADAWRAEGDLVRLEQAIAHAGPRASSFTAELEAARKPPARRAPSSAELRALVRTQGLAAAFTALGSDAPPLLAAELLFVLHELLETDPKRARSELEKLTAPLDGVVWGTIVSRAQPICGPQLLDRALHTVGGAEASLVLAVVVGALSPPPAAFLRIACGPALENPYVLGSCAAELDRRGLQRVWEAIDTRGDPKGGRPTSAELRVAVAEGLGSRRSELPVGFLEGVYRAPGPWSDYAYFRHTGKPRRPTGTPDPRIAVAAKEGRAVFTTTDAEFLAFKERLIAVNAALEELDALDEPEDPFGGGPFGFDPLLDEFLVEAGERRPPTAAEKEKKRAARKAQKAARKAGRKRR